MPFDNKYQSVSALYDGYLTLFVSVYSAYWNQNFKSNLVYQLKFWTTVKTAFFLHFHLFGCHYLLLYTLNITSKKMLNEHSTPCKMWEAHPNTSELHASTRTTVVLINRCFANQWSQSTTSNISDQIHIMAHRIPIAMIAKSNKSTVKSILIKNTNHIKYPLKTYFTEHEMKIASIFFCVLVMQKQTSAIPRSTI